MSEQIVTFGGARVLVGVVHRPSTPRADLPAVVVLNAGILHRVGPNRLYVTIARRLVALGFTVLRFDVWGIGDSQDLAGGPAPGATFVDDTLEAFDMLRDRFGAQRFAVMGICMGAQIALEVASRDARVGSLVLMEGIYVKSARYHLARLLAPSKWLRVATGRSHLVKQLRARLTRRRAPRTAAAPPAGGLLDEHRNQNKKQKLHALLARGARILMVFRDGNEIAYNYRLRRTGDRIVALGLPPALEVELIPFADHTFTPLLSQALLLEVTLGWMTRHHPIRAAVAA